MGAEVSVTPATGLDTNMRQPGPPLTAANSSSIRTYGTCRLSLHFASNKCQWNFIIADVTHPLLRAYFLRSNSLLVDLKGKRLMDVVTFHSASLWQTTAPGPHLDWYDMLLAEFPDITTLNFVHSPTKHGIEHFITTRGPPVHAWAH